MAFQRETTAELVKPLEGAVIRRYTAGSTIEAGEIVAMSADGYIDAANTTDFTVACVVGIALQDVLITQRVDVVVAGAVLCCSGGTPGALVYATDTAGEPAVAAGSKVVLVGVMESASVLFVRPEFIDRS